MLTTRTPLALAAGLALGVAFAPETASAAVLTNSASKPTTNIIDANDVSDTGGASVRWRDDGGDTDVGQTFVTPNDQNYILQAITFQTSNAESGSTNLPVIVGFFSFDGSSTFTALWRDTGSFPVSVPDNHYVTIDLANLPVAQRTLVAGQEYAWLIGSNQQDTSSTVDNRFRVLNTDGNDTTTEQVRRDFEFGGTRPALTSLPSLNANDSIFFIQAVPVPEPASLALVGLGSLLMLGGGRGRGAEAA